MLESAVIRGVLGKLSELIVPLQSTDTVLSTIGVVSVQDCISEIGIVDAGSLCKDRGHSQKGEEGSGSRKMHRIEK
jgi:hypothetical protein